MRSCIIAIALLLVSIIARAQAPVGIPYQAAARNSSGSLLASTAISVRFTIRDSVSSGAIKYRETHSVTTTAQGMFNVNVGQGTPVSGTFTSIKWGVNAKFMQVEIDPAGGSSYIDMGTQQMMSVPYALNTASIKLTVSATGDTLYSGGNNSVIIPGISAANAPPLTVGLSYGGGKIAYIFVAGDAGYVAGEVHGLIAAPSDQSTGIIWGCFGTNISGTSNAVGTGNANTVLISGAGCGSGTAARLCSDLVLGGYSDWYLPSKDEMSKLYINRAAIGGFDNAESYWTSTQDTSIPTTYAWYIAFYSSGNAFQDSKNANYPNVRAVRSF